MALHAGLALLVVALWWSTTGAIFLLGRLPARTFPASIAVTTLLLVAALVAIGWSTDEPGTTGACVAFAAAITVWGWLETTFLLGAITGPRRVASEPGLGGWAHFRHAFAAILWHELATVAALGVVALLCWRATNAVALWTLLLLWVMRVSAKLNLHLGVPNVGVTMLPVQLRYLAGYFRQGRVSALYPVSLLGCAAISATLLRAAWQVPGSEPQAAGLTLLATLALLGLFEHLMLALPVPADAFWSWMHKRRAGAVEAPALQRPAEALCNVAAGPRQ
jgi:putative photosynthetic complex assembly protein 2